MENVANGLKKVQNQVLPYLQSPYVFTAVAVFIGLIFAAAAIASRNPAAGEIAANAIVTAGLWTLAALSALFGLFIAFNFLRSGRAVWAELVQEIQEQAPLKIEAGRTWQDRLNISPDLILVPGPGETKEQFVDRVSAAKETVTASRWAVMFEPGNPIGTIFKPGDEGTIFHRSTPPLDVMFVKEIPMPSDLFSTETESEFRVYVEAFCRFFPEWAPAAKVQENPRRAAATVLEVFSPVLIGLLVLFSPGLFAQKAAQVETALGTRIREIPTAQTRIEYEFERGSVYRTADGRRDYVELLKSLPGYRDGGGGRFIALRAGGRVVCRGESVQDVAQRDEMRPNQAATPRTDEPVAYSLPDSIALEESLDRAKERVSFYQSEFWRSVRPVWGFAMFVFWALLPLLVIIGLVLWFWAKLSASEEMPTIHWHSSRGLVIIVGSVWTVGIINAMLTVIWFEPSAFVMFLAMLLIGAFAYKSAAWIVPNLNAKPGGRTAYYRGQANPMLPG